MNYLCIVSFPRSGSAALKNIINQKNEISLYNESNGLILNLCDFVIKIESLTSPLLYTKTGELKNIGMRNFNKLNIDNIYQSVKNIFMDDFLCANNEIVGWKENDISPIKFGEEKCYRYIDTLKKIFPNIKFIFNTRNPSQVATSSMWNRENQAIDKITQWNNFLNDCYIKNKSNSILIDYSEWSYNFNFLKNELTKIDIDINTSECEKATMRILNHLQNW